MELQLAGSGANVALSEAVFGKDFNEALVHQAVVAYMAGGRSGTKAQKNRSAVSGGGAKPWRQKGTGRARAGTSRSPLWRSGGVTFAAAPRDFSQKLNQKMYRAAMRSILSELVRSDRLVAVEGFDLESHKTSSFVAKMSEMGLGSVLVVDVEPTENVVLASRNVPHVAVSDVPGLSPVSLMAHDQVLVTKAALEKIEEWLS